MCSHPKWLNKYKSIRFQPVCLHVETAGPSHNMSLSTTIQYLGELTIVGSIDLMHWRHKGSHLHNNDASLVSRSAHVLCWQCALALSLSVRGPGRASPAVWLAGFAPLATCLAMTHVAVFRLTPNAAGRPSVTSYAYGLFKIIQDSVLQCIYRATR